MTLRERDLLGPASLFVTDNVFALVGSSNQPRILDDACDQPDIRLLGGIKAQNTEGSPERAWREVRKALPQNISLRIEVKFALKNFPEPMLVRHNMVICRRCLPIRFEPFRKVGVAHFVEHIERVYQKALMPGSWISDRIDVGGIFGIILGFKTQCRVDAKGAWIEGRS